MEKLRIHTVSLLFIVLFATQNTKLLAQNESSASHGKEIVNSDTSYLSFSQYFQEVILAEKLNYRKKIRESKKSGKVFKLSGATYSETEILKHFKRAASKSSNNEEFLQYFLNRNLEFIKYFDESIITEFYQKIRPKTFKGYIEKLDEDFISFQ